MTSTDTSVIANVADVGSAVEPDWVAAEVDHVVAAVTSALTRNSLPVSTYRLQFNSNFTFQNARDIVGYLARLGISDAYAAPLLRARAGSQHGYDSVSHGELNPDMGAREDFDVLSNAFRDHHLGLILDVVPNHMAASSTENPWWWDVLENGPSSQFAPYFDIDWAPVKPDLHNKVLLPVLGNQFGKVLEEGQLTVCFAEGSFWLQYFDQRYPIAAKAYGDILSANLDPLAEKLGADGPHYLELMSILTSINNLPPFTEQNAERLQERQREKEVIKRRLKALHADSQEIEAFIEQNLTQLNGRAGDPHSFDRLDEVLQKQPYRLAYWRVAADEINYRRFFDVNDLAAISMERPAVFEAAHKLVFDLLETGKVTGLRIDHPDGLFDPPAYFRQLQERRFLQLARAATNRPDDWPAIEPRLRELWRTGGSLPGAPLSRPLYVVVEKILEHGEEIPVDWLVHGTVGYEFLNALGGLFVNPSGMKLCSTTYARVTGDTLEAEELIYRCKRLIVRMSMSSELQVLANRLDRISEHNRWSRDFTLNSLARALEEVISGFEVYRTYVQPGHVLERDRRYIESAVRSAILRNPATDTSIFEFIRDILLLQMRPNADEGEREATREFVGKFQQLTGPIMAKSLEDTAFYRFNRLVSLNEVGGRPESFGNTRKAFHDLNASRLPRLAHGMSATSTHDTKRGEDTRVRISVLSEAPREWSKQVKLWVRQNKRLKTEVSGVAAPSLGGEYLLYQTLIGIWPGLPNVDTPKFVERVQQYMLKVAREAKLRTSWTNPREDYELALSTFVERLFQHSSRKSFQVSLDEFSRRVAEHGIWNSLSQVVLKVGSPGVCDFYQGTELWTLTLVDPDNRQPVNYTLRARLLDEVEARISDATGLPHDARLFERWLESIEGRTNAEIPFSELLTELIDSRQDGRVKLLTTVVALQARKRYSKLFTEGEYVPVESAGRFGNNVVAFARRDADRCVVVVVPRFTVDLCGFGGPPPLAERWADTTVALPADCAAGEWTDLFTGRRHDGSAGSVNLAEVLAQWPVSMLMSKPQSTT